LWRLAGNAAAILAMTRVAALDAVPLSWNNVETPYIRETSGINGLNLAIIGEF
jgi:hypothetical protein